MIEFVFGEVLFDYEVGNYDILNFIGIYFD